MAISNEKESNINIYNNINLKHIIRSNGSQTEKPYHSIYTKLYEEAKDSHGQQIRNCLGMGMGEGKGINCKGIQRDFQGEGTFCILTVLFTQTIY